jgi:ectoine hydroxylase-related dioxygenase (phytanoyl-CoA dioxygenase family)
MKNLSEVKLEKVKQQDFTFDSFEHVDLIKKTYDKFGIIIINNIINKDVEDELLNSSLYFYKLTSLKLGYKANKKSKLSELDYYIATLESKDRKASQQAQKLVSQSNAILNISNSQILDISSELLNAGNNKLVFESFGGFVPNIPSNTSRLYTWHSEAHWLPFRKSFVNTWAPLFRTKKNNYGTIYVKPFSHKDNHEFAEYLGFEGESSKDYYTQYEVPNNNRYPELAISASPGAVVFFHRNMLHKSEVNKSKNIGYLFNQRFFDVSLDLTISSNMGIRPYSKASYDIGRKLSDEFTQKF